MKRLLVVTLLMVLVSLLCGFTLFGGDISTVQKMVLEGTSRSITDVISQYKYIKNVNWSEEEVNSEKHVVLEFEYNVSFEADNPRWGSNPAFSATDGVLSFSQWITKENESPTSDSCFPLTVKVYFSLKDERHPLKFLISTLNAAVINVPAGDGKSASTIEYVPYDMFQQMERKTWLSFAESPLTSAYFAYRRKAERVAGQANHEKLLVLKTEMSQVLNRLPKPPAGSFVICHGEGTVPGHITGSVYTLEGISLDIDPAHREASIEDRAFMSVWHFFMPVGRDDFKESLKAQSTGSKLYALNSIQKEASGAYSVGWKSDGVNFTLRWHQGGYDLFWKDAQHVELMEILNPQEAFINACVPKTETKSVTGTLTANEDNTIFYLVDPESGTRLVEFSKSTPNIRELLQSRAPKLGAKFTIDFALSKDTQEVIRLIKAREIVEGDWSMDSLDESRRLREQEAQKEYDYYFTLHQGKSKRELGSLYHKTRNQNERKAISDLLKQS